MSCSQTDGGRDHTERNKGWASRKGHRKGMEPSLKRLDVSLYICFFSGTVLFDGRTKSDGNTPIYSPAALRYAITSIIISIFEVCSLSKHPRDALNNFLINNLATLQN